MVKRKKFRKQEEVVLTLDDLQSMRDGANDYFSKKNAQAQIDLHFMPPKPKRKKKEKKEKRYRERN